MKISAPTNGYEIVTITADNLHSMYEQIDAMEIDGWEPRVTWVEEDGKSKVTLVRKKENQHA